MKVSFSHDSSTWLGGALAVDLSGVEVGVLRRGVGCPQIVIFPMVGPGTFAGRQLRQGPVVSRRVIAVSGPPVVGCVLRAMRAWFGGLPTTRTLMSSAAWSLMACPAGRKMPPLRRAVTALHARRARPGPTNARRGAVERRS